MMGKNKTKDMTCGSPFKLIIGFAVPMLLGMLFQQFYSIVDTIIVGRYLGVSALASVGATGSIYFMIIGFCMGVCNGFAIPIAQMFGANKPKKLRNYVFNGKWIALVFSFVMTAAVCVLCKGILVLMKTPADIFDGAYTYIFIIFLGIPVTYLYNLSSGIIRAFGDSRTPLIFLVISSVINIALDLVFIIYVGLGVAGAALATVISQAVSGTLCVMYMKKKYSILKYEKDEKKLDMHYIKRLCSIGVPMGLQYSITAIGSVILQSAVNGLGSAVVASVTAASKIHVFLACVYDALGATMATYAGQNIGAGKYDRITEGIKKAALIGGVYAVLAFLFCVFFGENTALLFVDAGETEIIARVGQYLIFETLFFFPLCLVNVVRFSIQGMGFSSFAIFAGVFEMVARGFFGFVLVPFFGFTAVCLASPAAWIFADIFLIPAYIHVLHKVKKIGNLI